MMANTVTGRPRTADTGDGSNVSSLIDDNHDDACDIGRNSDSLPQHIKVYIEEELLRTTPDLDQVQIITNVKTFRSAQQQIYLVKLSSSNVGQGKRNDTVSMSSSEKSATRRTLEDALHQGNDYIVIKIWTGTSRWWNCHHIETTSPLSTISPKNEEEGMAFKNDMAQQEISGYQAAYEVFTSIQNEVLAECSSTAATINSTIRIPRILYTCINCGTSHPPWCIMEYVGQHSLNFYNHRSVIQYDTSYMDAMIPIRKEYGFDEPHLRWGRLPTHLCVPYTLQLLNSFVIPLHVYYFIHIHGRRSNEIQLPTNQMKIYNFGTVIELLKSKCTQYIEPNLPPLSDNDFEATIVQEASQILQTAIERLYHDEIMSSSMQNLPPVLCHMDLQPQNLIFGTTSLPSSKICSDYYRHEGNGKRSTASSQKLSGCQLLSVLDWEEAAYADPRFELILLCRKVCANREQADYIWRYYSDLINEKLASYEGGHRIQLGAITPWLKLEAVHSITTMLLECVAGGGRGDRGVGQQNSNGKMASSPLAKMKREFHRLHS